MIAPENLTAPVLTEIAAKAYELYVAAGGALTLDAESARQVCIAGARIAQLLGITVGIAATDPPTDPLIDFDAHDSETLDMDPEDLK